VASLLYGNIEKKHSFHWQNRGLFVYNTHSWGDNQSLISRYLDDMAKRFLTICIIAAIATSVLFASTEGTSATDTGQTKLKTQTTGPTVYLDYEDQKQCDNPVSDFMYFVPMISTVLVETDGSPRNTQKARIVSSCRSSNDKEFEAVCEFMMWGRGYHENIFDIDDIIAKDIDNVPKGKPLKNIIEYIRFEGAGRGRVEVKGQKIDGIEKVTSVRIVFNHDDNLSPVTIGLYSIRPQNGQYKFENRCDEKKARVNTISFEATEDQPRMDIQIASLGGRDTKEGFCSRVRGEIANLFIAPVRINPEGNKAMLDFGYALYKKQASFTFPKAANLKLKEDQQEPVLARADKDDKPVPAKSD
jgi:hypothetical protein